MALAVNNGHVLDCCVVQRADDGIERVVRIRGQCGLARTREALQWLFQKLKEFFVHQNMPACLLSNSDNETIQIRERERGRARKKKTR